MAHHCTDVTAVQREAVKKARDAFIALTGTRQGSQEDKWREHWRYNRVIRVALLQAIREKTEESDGEATWNPTSTTDESKADAAGNE